MYEEEKDQYPEAPQLDRSCRTLSPWRSYEGSQKGSEQEGMPRKGASMKVGDLVRMQANGSIWLVMCVVGDDALLHNIKTSYRMWATWNLTHDRLNYEVMSAA
jgi:hypothetical protein